MLQKDEFLPKGLDYFRSLYYHETKEKFKSQEGVIKMAKFTRIGVLTSGGDAPGMNAAIRAVTFAAQQKGVEVVPSAVQNASDIPSAADELASKVDCINNFTDNNVVNNLSVVLSAADKYKIPVYGSEEEQVKNGCLASVSIDYVALGKATGQMGVDVLGGADITKMAVKTITDATPIVNTDVLESLGMTLPAEYTSAQTVKTN